MDCMSISVNIIFNTKWKISLLHKSIYLFTLSSNFKFRLQIMASGFIEIFLQLRYTAIDCMTKLQAR
jgi:hypothetical protein